MIKLLLADDNKMSLQYFSSLIRWEDYGYTLVPVAVDGESAWYNFQKYAPEVVIADIKMPVLSGIELAQKVLEAAPDTVVLFLSSYKEFQYAHAALKLKVYDYLLKHETTQDALIQKLEEIRIYLTKEKEKKNLLIQEELSSFFLPHTQETSIKTERPSVLTDSYDCFFLEYDHPFSFLSDKLPTCFPSEQKLSQKELIQFFHTSRNTIEAIAISETQFFLLTEPSDNPFAFCCQFQQHLASQFEHSFRFVITAKNQPIQECALAVSQLRPILSEIYFYPVSAVIEGMYLHPQSETADTPCSFLPITAIQKDTCDIIHSQYQQIFDEKNFPAFCRMTEQLIQLLLTYHNHLVHPSTGQIVTIFSPDDLPKECDVDSVYQWIYKHLAYVTDILAMSHFSEYSGIVKEAVFLISCHYGNCNLNVEWIAEQLKISPSGLNAQFKRETNYTPWKVIINTRLEAAKKLLLQGMNPTQVYLCTGYNSLSYFSKAFKKNYGISPQDYGRSHAYEMDQI